MQSDRIAYSRLVKFVRGELVKRFPKTFMPMGSEKIPLKVGILRDIRLAWPEISLKDLKSAMLDYTRGPKYLRNMMSGAARVDLDGNPVGIVDEAQAEHAAKKLAKLLERAVKHKRSVIPRDVAQQTDGHFAGEDSA